MSHYPAYAQGGTPAGAGGSPSSSLAPGGRLVMGGGMDYVPGPELGDCHHEKDDGEFCGRRPKKGSLYCPLHKRADEALDFLNDALEDDDTE